MTIRQNCFAAAALLASFGLALAADAGMQAAPDDGLPHLGFSIAAPRPGNIVDGPLLQRARAAIAAANRGDAAFARLLAPNAELELTSFTDGGSQRTPFTAATIRAASESCLGPYPFTEGAGWVQLSWVCRVDGVGPLASLYTFQESPELSLTIWFEGDLIRKIQAMEPLWMPGARRVGMGAYAAMQGRR
ncbi:MAG TPA: hypothetical protein VEX35_03780 [Allosphingosinicella sp.]|nr:hypothetical protein [Allosphingosinicella sp.]